MPNVSNNTAAVNYVDYFTKQLPKDLAATERETELDAAASTLNAAQKALDARVTAFQDKVAALTA